MNNALKEIFGPIRAEEDLKNRTRAFLAERTRNYTRAETKKRRYPAYAAACACLLLVLLGGRWLYFTPTAAISIDINPSLELSVQAEKYAAEMPRWPMAGSVAEWNGYVVVHF